MQKKFTHSDDIDGLEHAQTCWVIPDIDATADFFSKHLGITFPKAQLVRAEDLNMTYNGEVVAAEWLTTQTYANTFIELVQPLSGRSMFHDFLAKHPAGGIQHAAYRLPISGFERVIKNFHDRGHELISEVHHPIARMAFFDTYKELGVVTEIMGITPEGWKAIKQMEKTNAKSE
jgi:methylmalonyl-CoA/ethylmalonyl-CoA epimerase